MSKHTVVGLAKSVAVELGQKGIRVVGAAPTMTDTDGVAAMRLLDEEINAGLNVFASRLPLGRSGRPDDVARALFLASDMACFVPGSVIPVDGGELAG